MEFKWTINEFYLPLLGEVSVGIKLYTTFKHLSLETVDDPVKHLFPIIARYGVWELQSSFEQVFGLGSYYK